MNQKYYYLKLKENFFDSEEMKILESQKNGVEYQNLYLKLCLLSIKNEGKLMFKDLLPYDSTMLSTVLRVNHDTVKAGIELFRRLELVEIVEGKTIYMLDIQSLIGKSSTEAERKKEYRSLIKNGQMSGQCPDILELEIEIEKEKDIYSEKSQNSSENSSCAKELAPAKAVAQKELSSTAKKKPQKTELEKRTFAIFWEATIKQGGLVLTPKNSATQAKACWQLVDQCIAQFENHALEAAGSIIQSFLDLKAHDTSASGFWRNQPLTPLALSGQTVWGQVLETMRKEEVKPEVKSAIDEICETMRRKYQK